MTLRLRHFRLAPLCAVLAFSAGCGGSDHGEKKDLSGTVSLDGQPLSGGAIRFDGLGGQSAAAGGTVVEDGRFSLSGSQGLPPGKYRVAITAPESTGEAGGMGAASATAAERVPKKYNDLTELMVEVSDSGPNTFDFPLQTAPAKPGK